MSLYDAYDLDLDAATHGQWVDFRAGVRMQLRSRQSEAVRRAEQKLQFGKYKAALMAGGMKLDIATQDAFDVDLCAEAIVVAWEHVTDREGRPIPFSKDAVRTLLSDPKLAGLRREVLFAASVEETFRPELAAEVAAPLSRPSAPAQG